MESSGKTDWHTKVGKHGRVVRNFRLQLNNQKVVIHKYCRIFFFFSLLSNRKIALTALNTTKFKIPLKQYQMTQTTTSPQRKYNKESSRMIYMDGRWLKVVCTEEGKEMKETNKLNTKTRGGKAKKEENLSKKCANT